MKKNLIALTLLAIATGAMVAACGPTVDPSDDSSVKTPVSSSEETPVSSSESSEEEIEPTRVAIQQPGVVTVGQTLKVSEIVTFTPATANKYVVVSTNEEVATVTDNETITIVGAGTCGVQIKKVGGSVLGQINITAMTEAGKNLQEFANSVTNNFLLDDWATVYSGKWADVTESSKALAEWADGILMTEKYSVVQGIFSTDYSAIALDKADGSTYSYKLKTAAGEEVDWDDATSLKDALATAASVEIGDKCSSAYLNSYFVIDGILEVNDFTEGEDGWFTANDGATTSLSVLGNVLGVATTSYTGVGVKAKMTEGALELVVQYETAAYAYERHMSITTGVSNALLEDAVKNAEPPAKLDVTELASHYAAFGNNYKLHWDIGVFSSSTFAVSESYVSYCKTGTALYNDEFYLYAAANYAADAVNPDLESLSFGGFVAEASGIYKLSVDEDGTIVKGAAPVSTQFSSLSDILYRAEDVDATVLDAAGLTLTAQSGSTKQYKYDCTSDNLGLAGIIEDMSPFSYSNTEEWAQYTTYGIILDAGTQIMQAWAVSIGSGNCQGYKQTLYGADTVTVGVGSKIWEAFPEYVSAPSAE